MTGSPKVTERFDLRRLYETMVLIRLFEPEEDGDGRALRPRGGCRARSRGSMHLLDVGRNVLAKNLENAALPNEDKILDAALATLG